MQTVLAAATQKRNRNNRSQSMPVPHAVFEVVRGQYAEPDAHQEEPRLLDRVREVIRFRHYSLRTEEAYLGWIRRFVRFHGNRHPEGLGTDDVRSFLTDLAVNGRVAAPTQNQALSALLFLYQQVLKKDGSAARGEGSCAAIGCAQANHLPHVPAFVRYASAGERL